jgi:hypothetical protein
MAINMKKTWILLLCCLLILSGCSSEKFSAASLTTSVSVSSSLAITDLPKSSEASGGLHADTIAEHISESINDNIKIEADVVYPTSNKVNSWPIQLQSFDFETAKTVLLRDRSILSQTQVDSGEVIDSVTADDKSELFRNGTSLEFSTPFSADSLSNVVNWTSYLASGEMNIDSEQKDLDFAGMTDIEQQCKTDLAALGLSQSLNMHIYAMDYQYLTAKELELKNSGHYDSEVAAGLVTFKDSWNTSDDCYVITAEFQPDTFAPILNQEVRLGEFKCVAPSYIWAVYSERGIEYLHIEHAYVIDYQAAKNVDIISYQDAKQVVIDKFDSIITDDKYTINGITLSYAPQTTDKKEMLVPVWTFDISQQLAPEPGKISKGDNLAVKTYQLLIDAVTGKEIMLNAS